LISPAPWGPDLVEAYAMTGRVQDARRLTARLVADAHEHPSGWTRAAIARCHGLTANERELDAYFHTALTEFAALPTPLESARTQLSYGRRLLELGRSSEAQEQFDHASARLALLSASPSFMQAEVTPAPDRSVQGALASLTPREYQVASLVARGATNPEVAEALFISRHTVEHHLSNVYRKVGVRSRTDLARVVASG
jgi:DNA-binding CsgD family transcriptional regulator